MHLSGMGNIENKTVKKNLSLALSYLKAVAYMNDQADLQEEYKIYKSNEHKQLAFIAYALKGEMGYDVARMNSAHMIANA